MHAYLQNAIQGVEGQPSKGGQGVLLVVLVVNVVQHPAEKKENITPFGISFMRSQVLYRAAQMQHPVPPNITPCFQAFHRKPVPVVDLRFVASPMCMASPKLLLYAGCCGALSSVVFHAEHSNLHCSLRCNLFVCTLSVQPTL